MFDVIVDLYYQFNDIILPILVGVIFLIIGFFYMVNPDGMAVSGKSDKVWKALVLWATMAGIGGVAFMLYGPKLLGF